MGELLNPIALAMAAKISGGGKPRADVYKAGGSVAFAALPTADAAHMGIVYNVTDAFTTTADFVEGAGASYPAGTNVGIVNAGTNDSPVYKYDVLGSSYAPYDETPEPADAEGSPGDSADYARGDHVHPESASVSGLYEAKTLGPAPIVSFDDGIEGAVLGKCVVNIEPVQAGSGDPSPDNVRAISGWTGVDLTVSPTTTAGDGTIHSIPFTGTDLDGKTLPGTVYGGTLDVGTGVLTVDRVGIDLSTISWGKRRYTDAQSDFNWWTAPLSVRLKGNSNYPVEGALGDKWIVLGTNYLSRYYSIGVNSGMSWVSAVTERRAGDDVPTPTGLIVWPLATPETYRLSPTQVKTLLGLNNIYADCGDVTVSYRGDIPNLYALHNAQEQAKADSDALAFQEPTNVASQNYASGRIFTIGGKLYKATEAIASGEALTPGTNILQTTMDAIKQDQLTNDSFYALLDEIAPPELHRTLFRGKSLGTALTSDQKARIQDGTFKGLWLGDYWTINSKVYRIVDFDYWLKCGDTAFNSHHLVVMPDKVMYNAKMNDTNTTEGGYIGSKMYTEYLEPAKTTLTTAFGTSLLTHRNIFVNAVTDGKASSYEWVDSNVDLPNEIMMYGTTYFRPANNGANPPNDYTIDNSQLALMQVCTKFIKTRETQWLRDVVSAARFAGVYSAGNTPYLVASNSCGVRPAVAVG